VPPDTVLTVARLRFGTFNLLHGLVVATGTVRESDLWDAVRSLDTDVLALQEVDRGQERSHKIDQAAVAADAMSAQWWRFAPVLNGTPGSLWVPADPLSDPPGPAYGIALASRLPVLSWHARSFPAGPVRLPLSVPGQRGLRPVADHPRAALGAVLIGPDGPFTVVATHLSFVPGWNVRQLRSIARWLTTMPAPRLMLGDLNLPGVLPSLIGRQTQLAHAATYPSWRPRVQIDHVLADGLGMTTVRAVSVQRLPISDHAALTVDIEW
jgi:endonuclease/exonuclease/phosphatase family metal-dependent hydrolase